MSNLQAAIKSVAIGAVLGGLDAAETVNVSEIVGLSGEGGAAITAIVAIILAWLHQAVAAEDSPDEDSPG